MMGMLRPYGMHGMAAGIGVVCRLVVYYYYRLGFWMIWLSLLRLGLRR